MTKAKLSIYYNIQYGQVCYRVGTHHKTIFFLSWIYIKHCVEQHHYNIDVYDKTASMEAVVIICYLFINFVYETQCVCVIESFLLAEGQKSIPLPWDIIIFVPSVKKNTRTI